jgi:hypothetical protein
MLQGISAPIPGFRRAAVLISLAAALSLVLVLSAAGASPANYLQTDKLTASDGAVGDQFGRWVATDGDAIVVSTHVRGGGVGGVYVYTRNGGAWTQSAILEAPDAEAGNWFGYGLDISGDTIVVGAHRDDDACSDCGAVHVFEMVEGVFSRTAKLTASTAYWMGRWVAVDGDTIVAGGVLSSYGDKDYAGDAYVFERIGGEWTQTARLTASDGASQDTFGQSVAVDGTRIVVGADWHDGLAEDAGAAYVYEKVGGVWTETAKLEASDGAAFDGFGSTVDIDGDTIIAATYGDPETGVDGGEVYVFEYDGVSWAESAPRLPSDGAAGDTARMASISGDWIAVGGPYHDAAANNAGAVWLYERSDGEWTEVGKLLASDAAEGDRFSQAAISGDVIVVGAAGADAPGEDSGAAYVFEREVSGALIVWMPLVTS